MRWEPAFNWLCKHIKKVSSSQAAILLLNWLKHTFSPWVSLKHRRSHWRCSERKGVVRNLSTFTGKHLCQSLFFDKCAGVSPATLLRKRLWHGCFLVNFEKFLRTPFLQNTSGGCFWTQENTYSQRFYFKVVRGNVLLKNSTKNFSNSSPFKRLAFFYITATGSFGRFHYSNIETCFLKNKKLFWKSGVVCFSW